ncbi:MAG: hypothetical protein CML23_21050 [Rhizobiaceae bacterium]|nr:hypothetical protein [Rhizobiaceae bacterium]
MRILDEAFFPELPNYYRGKVRENYDLPDGRRIIITTDRISAFDRVLASIPHKGAILTQIARFWFDATGDIAENHVVAYPDPNVVVGKRLDILPVEIIVRGYLAGATDTSLLTRYKRGERRIYGFDFADGMRDNEALPEAIITPRLQRVLDAIPMSPALIRTATWDVIAWNRAAALILTDYGLLPPDQRNILRLIFSNARVRAAQDDWLKVARFVVGAFRADAARAGAGAEIGKLVEELSATSPEFAALWRDNEVAGQGDGAKRIHHAELGPIELEFSTFSVEGRPDLTLMVYTPATDDVARRMEAFIGSR